MGKAVARYLQADYDEIVILTRGKPAQEGKTRYVYWDAATDGNWSKELEGSDALLNTAGKNIDCRFTKKNRELILSSRVDSTRILGECISRCKTPPRIWINCSSAAIYGTSDESPFNEDSPATGKDFMAHVSREWENAFNSYNAPGVRKAILRISLILGNEGGIYPVLRGLAAKGLGGKMGNGKQKMSVVHLDDVCRIVGWMIKTPSAKGAYNIAIPEVFTNAEFMKLLRGKAGMPIGIASPKWALNIGGFILGKEPGLLLESHNTPPAKLLKEGFVFKYRTAKECVDNLS